MIMVFNVAENMKDLFRQKIKKKGIDTMKHFHCPVNGWDCPYFKNETIINSQKETCICSLENPMDDCDDFYSMWGDCKPDDYTDDN